MEIGDVLTPIQINQMEHLSQFNGHETYLEQENEHGIFLVAVDHNRQVVSCFEFAEREEGFQLAHMYTLPANKGQGFGSELMRQAVNQWTEFELPSTNSNDMYYFIEDGLCFTRSCFTRNILTTPPFRYPV
jgi:GNAT superfamily N-acetyltransferase